MFRQGHLSLSGSSGASGGGGSCHAFIGGVMKQHDTCCCVATHVWSAEMTYPVCVNNDNTVVLLVARPERRQRCF